MLVVVATDAPIAGIAGIDVLESTSRAETSRITVRFNSIVDQDVAASDVRDRVSRLRRRLPVEVQEPNIAKVEADAQAIMNLVFTSDRMNALEISDYVDRFVLDRLKNLNGVADVTIYGERRYAMRIWIDRERLAAFNLTVQDVENALKAQNVELPSGRIESRDREFSVLSRTGLVTPEQFRNIIIKIADAHQVKLGEVARVELGAADERRDSRYNGQPAITVGIVKQAVANPLERLQGGARRHAGDQPVAAAGVDGGHRQRQLRVHRPLDCRGLSHHRRGHRAGRRIVFFLRSLRASLIPIVTIPISLIGTFTLLYALGFTVNTLTLLAMVLAIGLVVDDAIVVLENIYRRIEHGMRPIAAAIEGTKEIGFAVIAMTLTLAAVYAPIAFAPGRTGRLFLEFALTLAGAVAVSGFVALTLTPMMCSKLLKHNANRGRLFNLIERGLAAFGRGYRRALIATLRVRPLVILATVGVAALSGVFFLALKSELAPTEDRGLIQVRGTGPEGATLAYTRRYSNQVGEILAQVPEIESTLIVNGSPEVSRFQAIGRLADWDKRTRSQQSINAEINPALRSIPGVRASASNPGSFGARGSSRPVEFVLQTSGTYEQLQEYVDRMLEKLRDYPGLDSVETDLQLNMPEIRIDIDRAKVADLELDITVVGRTLETLLGGRQVTRFEQNGEQYDVMVQLAAEDRASPQTLSTIFLRSPRNEMVQLSNIVKVREAVAPKELRRFNQLRAVTISANLGEGYALGDVLAFLERTAREVLPETVLTDVSGQSREYRSAGQSLLLVFLLALGFIYLVLAAQFESFRDPLIILVTVPLSMTGALGTLWLAGGTLNVFSQIGLVTLVGLITKHGILIVEFANQLQEKGRDRLSAAVDAAGLRLRPILMTTGAMVLGALPLAIASGAGAESRQQIGWVIVGGMSFGTLLTLLVVPTVYTLLGQVRDAKEEPAGPAAASTPAE